MDSFVKKILFEVDVKDKLKTKMVDIAGSAGKKLTDVISNGFKSATDFFVKSISDAFKNSIDEMKNMLEFSQLSSSKTREYAFNYGFSSSEAYGYEKALKLVGLESEEDLYYANNQELKQFRQAFEKYSNYYNKLYDEGFFEKLQEYQFEMEDFKLEMQMEIIDFFLQNKDLIKSGMTALMNIAKTLLSIADFLLGSHEEANRALTTSEILSSYNNVNNSSTNVNVNNNFNGVGSSDESSLADLGSLTYAQIIQALGGK